VGQAKVYNYTEIAIERLADSNIWKVNLHDDLKGHIGVLLPLDMEKKTSICVYDTGIYRLKDSGGEQQTVLLLAPTEAADLAGFIMALLQEAGATEILKKHMGEAGNADGNIS